MDRKDLDHVAQLISDEVSKRFPGVPVEGVELLQYGDEPVVEPGDFMVRVTLASADDEAEREKTLHKFERVHHKAIRQLREELTTRLPEASRLEFRAGGGENCGPVIVLARPRRSLEARAAAGGDLTPVMARLGAADLQTLDTLITAGI